MTALEFLKENEHKSEKGFLDEARYIRDNWGWLKYSYEIAIKVKMRMDELGWTQKQLSQALGCTQQHISTLLRGKANMTLETLSKLEEALQFDLIGGLLEPSPRPYRFPIRPSQYLNEPRPEDSTFPTSTSAHVAGYQPRRKKGPKKKD